MAKIHRREMHFKQSFNVFEMKSWDAGVLRHQHARELSTCMHVSDEFCFSL
jgi:hypothetical protein